MTSRETSYSGESDLLIWLTPRAEALRLIFGNHPDTARDDKVDKLATIIICCHAPAQKQVRFFAIPANGQSRFQTSQGRRNLGVGPQTNRRHVDK